MPLRAVAGLLSAGVALAGCGSTAPKQAGQLGSTCSGKLSGVTYITVWFHASASARFAAGGPEHLYVEQREDGVARPRPQTPAYPALTAAFAGAVQSVVVGLKPVKPTLDAARSVTADLIAHGYYANTAR